MHRFYFDVVVANFDHFNNIYFQFIFLTPCHSGFFIINFEQISYVIR